MKIVRNILALIAGVVVGSFVNMGIIQISGAIIPPPEGVDNTTMEGLKASMHLLEPKHFILPFFAHALGTMVGAIVTALIVVNHKMKFAMAIGIIFLMLGITTVFMIPAPTWFSITDVIGAYLPFAWFGGLLAQKKRT